MLRVDPEESIDNNYCKSFAVHELIKNCIDFLETVARISYL